MNIEKKMLLAFMIIYMVCGLGFLLINFLNLKNVIMLIMYLEIHNKIWFTIEKKKNRYLIP